MAGEALIIWTIYDHPLDAPNCFIARRWDVVGKEVRPTVVTLREYDLQELREQFAISGLMCIPRLPGDDPKIVETWL